MMNLHQAYRIPSRIQARLVPPACLVKASKQREDGSEQRRKLSRRRSDKIKVTAKGDELVFEKK